MGGGGPYSPPVVEIGWNEGGGPYPPPGVEINVVNEGTALLWGRNRME